MSIDGLGSLNQVEVANSSFSWREGNRKVTSSSDSANMSMLVPWKMRQW